MFWPVMKGKKQGTTRSLKEVLLNSRRANKLKRQKHEKTLLNLGTGKAFLGSMRNCC